jgi:CubicO group peptidase (beta-lactamase class C family)
VPLQSPLKYPPGTRFSYSSGTTNLLSLLFTQRVGGPQNAINHLYQDILWPMGMHDTTLEPDASGVFVGSSNIYATARDWARLGEIFLHEGELNGVRIAPKSYMRELVQPNTSNNDRAYGYQVWLNRGEMERYWPDLPEDAYGFTGNRGQAVMILPTQQAVMVRLGWSAKNYPRNKRFADWLNALPSQG